MISLIPPNNRYFLPSIFIEISHKKSIIRANFLLRETHVPKKLAAKVSSYGPFLFMVAASIGFTLFNAMYWGGLI